MEKLAQILIYLLILFVTNIFGLFNVLEDYRLPGIGKPSDFVLEILWILLLFAVVQKKLTHLPSNVKSLMVSNLLIIFYIFFLVFHTVYVKNLETFNYSLRVAAPFLYYSLFLVPILLIDNERYLYKFINFLRLCGSIIGIVTILSNLLGYNIGKGVYSAHEGRFVRLYYSGFFNYFVILMWLGNFLLKRTKRSFVKISYIELLINFLSIVLFVGRTRIIVLLLMIFYTGMFLTKGVVQKFKIILGLLVLLGGSIIALKIWGFPIVTISERFLRGIDQLKDPEWALSGRWRLIRWGFSIFAMTPLFGTGFVHIRSDFFQNYLIGFTGEQITLNVDFGLVSILYTTGILGFLIILNFIAKFLISLYKKLKLQFNSNKYDLKFIFGLSVFANFLFIFFVEQIAGGEFITRGMAIDLLSGGFAVKFLLGEKKIRED